MEQSSVNRSIYFGDHTKKQIYSSQFSMFQSEEGSQTSIYTGQSEAIEYFDELQNIKEAYQNNQYYKVIELATKAIEGYQLQKKTYSIKKNAANITYDLSIIRSILATTYLNLYKTERKLEYVKKAASCLNYEYGQIQTRYKKAQRLNNLGLCQIIEQKYNNSFKHLSQAFSIYSKESDLNIFGLIKNISQVYKQLEMYEVAFRYYELIFDQFDRANTLETNEYVGLIISALECINQCNDIVNKSVYQRAKQLLPKVDQKMPFSFMIMAKLRLEMIKFAVKFGIHEKYITENETFSLLDQVLNIDCQDFRMDIIKGECCYAIRELFKGIYWDKYSQLTIKAAFYYKRSYIKTEKQ